MQKKAIILFSGGLDSTTCLVIAKQQGFACYALSFDYEQKHKIELEQAKKLAKQYDVIEHKILSIPLNEISNSSLTDPLLAVPDFQNSNHIPNTYVPARNTIFLSLALAWAEVIKAQDIFFGANFVDYSGYADCRPKYLDAFSKLAKLATRAGVEEDINFKIHTPLLKMNKAEIIAEGIRLGIDYGQTISCYRVDAKGGACGKCDSCTYRKRGFKEAGIVDPTVYT